MNKVEAAEFLSISVRQLERLAGAKRIQPYKVRTSKGQVADFRQEDLEQLKGELAIEAGRVVVDTASLHSLPDSLPEISNSPLTTLDRTLNHQEIEALLNESTALARVSHPEQGMVLAASHQDSSPVFADVFAASLRVLLSVADVCQLAQLSEKRVRDALKTGALKGARIGNSWRIHRDDFDKWVRKLI